MISCREQKTYSGSEKIVFRKSHFIHPRHKKEFSICTTTPILNRPTRRTRGFIVFFIPFFSIFTIPLLKKWIFSVRRRKKKRRLLVWVSEWKHGARGAEGRRKIINNVLSLESFFSLPRALRFQKSQVVDSSPSSPDGRADSLSILDLVFPTNLQH